MRALLIILVAALTLGLAGGYAWSVATAPDAKAPRLAKATTIAIPPSPEEMPASLDQEWTSRADGTVPEAVSPGAATGAPAPASPTKPLENSSAEQ